MSGNLKKAGVVAGVALAAIGTAAIKAASAAAEDQKSQALLATGDMNAIMAELSRTTGGSAAAAADTAAGKMARFQVAMDETQETMGTALLPVMGALAGVMTTVANFAAEHATIFQILIGV